VLEQPRLARIVGSSSAVLPLPIKGGKVYLYNNNPLLRMRYPGADGVKTGYTVAAGQCLVATAMRGGRWLGVVLLHSANTPDQAQRLLNLGFATPGT
jgi:D-alanyl-D-alanine carboxypeptidase